MPDRSCVGMIFGKKELNCSVIVCTHDRCRSLARTLSALTSQVYDDGDLEILVVDNGSSDQTESVVRAAREDSDFPVRYFLEPTIGLSIARNRGVQESSGDVLLFIDDDAVPCDHRWVRTLAQAFQDQRVGAVGGELLPSWPNGTQPGWVPDLLLYNLGVRKLSRLSWLRRCQYPDFPFGGNIAFRRTDLQRVGGFDSQLGRVGDELCSGEEQEMCLRMETIGRRILDVAGAGVVHYISESRLTIEWFEERSRWEGRCKAMIERKHLARGRFLRRRLRHRVVLLSSSLGLILFSRILPQNVKVLFHCQNLQVRAYFAHLG